MRCFQHPDQDAVGICKSCGKGLCGACAVDLRKGLACRASCEEDVRGLIQLIEANMQISPVGAKVWLGYRGNQLWNATAMVLLGLLFGGFGAFNEPPLALVVAMGAVFTIWGVFQAIQAFRLRAAAAKRSGSDVTSRTTTR